MRALRERDLIGLCILFLEGSLHAHRLFHDKRHALRDIHAVHRERLQFPPLSVRYRYRDLRAIIDPCERLLSVDFDGATFLFACNDLRRDVKLLKLKDDLHLDCLLLTLHLKLIALYRHIVAL